MAKWGEIANDDFSGRLQIPDYSKLMPQPAKATDPKLTQVGGDHYKSMAIQPIDYITQNNLGWCEGNIVKYITRWKQKGGVSDIDKVIHYAEILKGMQK